MVQKSTLLHINMLDNVMEAWNPLANFQRSPAFASEALIDAGPCGVDHDGARVHMEQLHLNRSLHGGVGNIRTLGKATYTRHAASVSFSGPQYSRCVIAK